MTDFWQGQRPWFALDDASRRDREHERDREERRFDRSPSSPRRDEPRHERAEEFVQRSIQRTYER